MLKFEKITPEQEDGHYYNVEADFRSLQISLGFADSGYQSPLKPDPLDPIFYEIYGKLDDHGKIAGIGHADVHSSTAFGTFYSPLDKKIFEAEDNNGKKWIFEDDTKLKVKRKNLDAIEEVVIKGQDIQEDDEILGLM